jgi:hypothetical protein
MSDKPDGVDATQAIVEDGATQTEGEREQRQAVEELSHLQGKDGQHSMDVRVYSPFHDYYDGRAFSVSAVNATGPFDILPTHHNFISLLSACDLVVRTVKEGDDRRIRISGGIVQVKTDKVVVFLDV